MKGFFDQLTEQEYPSLCDFIRSMKECTHDANVECVVRELEERSRMPLSPEWAQLANGCFNYASLSNELNDYCIARLADLAFDGGAWSTRLVAGIAKGATVITTNYDCLADRLLSCLVGNRHGRFNPTCPHCKMCAILEDDCACRPNGPIPADLWRGSLLKLHGSIAWKTCHANGCNVCGCLQPDSRCRPLRDRTCSCCGSVCKPVIVMPSEQKNYSHFPEIRRMWDAAFQAILYAREFVVVGFSFSETDCEIRRMCKASFAANTSLQSVTIVDVDPDSVAKRLEPLLPERDFAAYLHTVPRDGSKPDWLVFSQESAVSADL